MWVGKSAIMTSIKTIVRSVLFGLLLACELSSCSHDGKPVSEGEYPKAIVGNWSGQVGNEAEAVSFNADGSFVAQVRGTGFISGTLGQGVTGTIRGAWVINGKNISLNINSADDVSVLNKSATGTIEKFETNELVVKNGSGVSGTLVRK
jgi:hypothetical protein